MGAGDAELVGDLDDGVVTLANAAGFFVHLAGELARIGERVTTCERHVRAVTAALP